MTNFFINFEIYHFFTALFFIFLGGYIYFRILGRKIQKKLGIENLEFWIFYNIRDFLKDLGYNDFENIALGETVKIIMKYKIDYPFNDKLIDNKKVLNGLEYINKIDKEIILVIDEIIKNNENNR